MKPLPHGEVKCAPPRRSTMLRRRPAGQRADDDEGLGERRLVGDRQVDAGDHPGRRHGAQTSESPAGQHHAGPPGGKIDDAEIAPEHAGAKPGAKRLRASFLGGIALGIAGGPVGPPVGFAALDVGEDAIEEPLAEPLDHPLDARDVDEVAADAEDHMVVTIIASQTAQALFWPWLSARTLSISARIRLIALSRPLKIASPTRKWPILSSTMAGIAATGPTVSKLSPWPAWHSSPRSAACAAASTMRCSSRRAGAPPGSSVQASQKAPTWSSTTGAPSAAAPSSAARLGSMKSETRMPAPTSSRT